MQPQLSKNLQSRPGALFPHLPIRTTRPLYFTNSPPLYPSFWIRTVPPFHQVRHIPHYLFIPTHYISSLMGILAVDHVRGERVKYLALEHQSVRVGLGLVAARHAGEKLIVNVRACGAMGRGGPLGSFLAAHCAALCPPTAGLALIAVDDNAHSRTRTADVASRLDSLAESMAMVDAGRLILCYTANTAAATAAPASYAVGGTGSLWKIPRFVFLPG